MSSFTKKWMEGSGFNGFNGFRWRLLRKYIGGDARKSFVSHQSLVTLKRTKSQAAFLGLPDLIFIC